MELHHQSQALHSLSPNGLTKVSNTEAPHDVVNSELHMSFASETIGRSSSKINTEETRNELSTVARKRQMSLLNMQ